MNREEPAVARIVVEEAGGIARVTIANAARLNALTRAMWLDLRAAFEALGTRPDLRVVLIRGEGGKAFSAGADIAEFSATRSTFDQVVDFHENAVGAALGAIGACPVPVLAQIQGSCMGGGLEIACVCDLRIAGESARLGAPVARLGFPLAFGETEALFRLAGPAVCAELLLEGRSFAAAEALAKGLLSRVVPDGKVAEEAEAAAAAIAAMSPWAIRSHKRQLSRLTRDPSPVRREERMDVYAFAHSDDYRIGVEAFLAKRKPEFTGR